MFESICPFILIKMHDIRFEKQILKIFIRKIEVLIKIFSVFKANFTSIIVTNYLLITFLHLLKKSSYSFGEHKCSFNVMKMYDVKTLKIK